MQQFLPSREEDALMMPTSHPLALHRWKVQWLNEKKIPFPGDNQ
jgi:hypothetical protein